MKKLILITGLIAVVAVVLITGCDKNFVAINTDPEHLTAASMSYPTLFTSAELITSGNSDGNGYEDWRASLIYCSTMMQHLSSTYGYWEGDKYGFNSGYASSYWDQNYPNTVKNIVEVVNHTANVPGQSNFYNIARIFSVFMFQRMTDLYGDCPYSQAGLGYLKGVTSPKYDKQDSIYFDMLNTLQDAASKLDPSAPNTVGSADLIYQGNVAQWKKFAYAEMVRLAMRMSKVDPTDAQKWVNMAVQGGVMQSNADNAIILHQAGNAGNTISNGNGWILDGQDPDAAHISLTFMDQLKFNNDPRLPWIATVCVDPTVLGDMGDTASAVQLGQPNGYDNGGGQFDISLAPNWPGTHGQDVLSDQNKYSVVNRYTFSRIDAPTFFLTYAETALLLAEAAQRGWITTGSAASYYNNGVAAAILQLNQTGAALTASQAATYLAMHPYDPANGLSMINTQYWIATFMDEYEAFANWRRSGYPLLNPVNENYPGSVTNGTIPRRLTYPTTEAATNTSNYNAAVADLDNGDKLTSRVWWDTK
ncbi:MAG: SusD/RagB family nutrient-binding outer membrane lipoprotein [Chitinophagaceae bacterium]|nr:MAG: SusD/RagB family nutrient-binding outer membrane lipoprotein [Chitinophagaceae bacterium]